MKIEATKALEVIRLHNKTNATREEKDYVHAARREDPALDRMIYDQDKAKLFEESTKTERLAKKLARGEFLTQQERQYLEEKNPDLLKRAVEAKRQARVIKDRLKQIKNPNMANQMITSTMISIIGAEKYDRVSNSILKEAVQKVVTDYKKQRK